MVTVNWTAAAVVRFGVSEFVDSGRIAGVFWARTLVLAANLLLLVGTSPLWIRPLASALSVPRFLAPLLLLHLTTAALWYHMQQALMAAKLPKLNAALLTFERVTIVVSLSAIAALWASSLQAVVAAYIAAPLLCAAIAAVLLRRMIFPWTRIHQQRMRELLRFSVPLLPSALVSYFASSYLDSFFIARFMDAAAVGVYAVAYQFAGASMMLIVLAGSLLQPFFISIGPEMREQRIRLYTTRVLPVITLGWSLAAVIGAAIGGPLLLQVFGGRYAATGSVLWPLMASVAIGGPAVAGYFPIAYATNRTHILAINSIAGATLNVVLDLVLIPRYGLLGCAWATVAAYLAGISVTTYLTDRALNTRTWWNALSTLPAVIAAAFALQHYRSSIAAVAGVLAAALIATIRRAEVAEGSSILLRVLRWQRAS